MFDLRGKASALALAFIVLALTYRPIPNTEVKLSYADNT